MAVTQVGTPAAPATLSGSGTATGTWSGTQPRTAGDLLLMVVTSSASTSTAISAQTSGWTQIQNVGNTGTAPHSAVAMFWLIATGGDAAPSCTITISGTGLTWVTMIELTGVSQSSPVDTSGTYASGSSSTTISAPTATTTGNVSAAGEYAVAAFTTETSAGTTVTWTPGGSFSNLESNASTSTRDHNFVDILANPASGSTCSDAATITSLSSAFGAGVIAVFAPGTASAALSGTGTLGASPYFDETGTTLTGAGTLTASPVLAPTATLTGAGTLTASPVLAPTATLTGAGTLTASPVLGAAASLSGIGTLTATGTVSGHVLKATGTATVTDPRDTIRAVSGRIATAAVTDPRDGTHSVS